MKARLEALKIAFSSIRSQWLRAALTMSIITIGITALIGILTSIQAIESSIFDEFTSMGANTFVIQQKTSRGRSNNRKIITPRITYKEAQSFVREYKGNVVTSISCMASSGATAKYERKKTNPNIQVIGGDANYLRCSGYTVGVGRNFSPDEVTNNARVAVIGQELRDNLFSPSITAVGKRINVNGAVFEIIGVLKAKGSAFGFGGDRQLIAPVTIVRYVFADRPISFSVNVLVDSPTALSGHIAEATAFFRIIRGIPVTQNELDFDVRRSDSLAAVLVENLNSISLAAIFIGLITLLGAVIGLLNIMLVSVTERTREVGLRLAVGAKQEVIREQFLIEAILICQMGGALGVVFGILMGNVVSYFLEIEFFIPWLWTLLGVVLCFVVGVVGGYYPASKAAALNPVEALRHE